MWRRWYAEWDEQQQVIDIGVTGDQFRGEKIPVIELVSINDYKTLMEALIALPAEKIAKMVGFEQGSPEIFKKFIDGIKGV